MCFLLWFLLHLNFSIQHPWSRAWQPTPVFLLGKFHGQRCLVADSPWGRRVAHDCQIPHSASRESRPLTKPWCGWVGWGLRLSDHWHSGSVPCTGAWGRSSHGRAPGRAHRFQGPLVAALSRDGTPGSIVWSRNADTNKGSEIPVFVYFNRNFSRQQESNNGNLKGKVKSLSRVRLFATPRTVARQASLSMGFSRQECWSGLPFPSPGDLPSKIQLLDKMQAKELFSLHFYWFLMFSLQIY